MGTALVQDDIAKLHVAIGFLRSEVQNLVDKFDELKTEVHDRIHALQESSTEEHRKVHDIVVAQSEAVRNLDRDVREIKPLAETFKMKAEKLDDAISVAKDYRVEKAEERGAEKYKNWIYGLFASAGGLVAVLLGKLIDRMMSGR